MGAGSRSWPFSCFDSNTATGLQLGGPGRGRRASHASPNPCTPDSGPPLPRQFLVREGTEGREVAGMDWAFNAWGGLYDDYGLDRQIGSSILKA